ncbi:MAG: hypothetical protein OEV06_12010, partial [Anaerolineae bacterium]|nr:hypothetical protein [Anaerolineae bacterium]
HLDIGPNSGIRRIVLRTGRPGETLLILEGGSAEEIDLSGNLPVSIIHQGPKRTRIHAGTDQLVYSIKGREFQVSAGSFFQSNLPVAQQMISQLLENLPLHPDSTLLELYSGVGFFSAFLAPHVRRLMAVESSPGACEDFEANLAEFDNVELYQDAAENVLSAVQAQADILLVDPPRAGLHPRVMDAVLQKVRPAFIAYVSCDPATLGRDSRKLTDGGYRLIRVSPFDMFPQTYHIESISYWEAV